MKQITILALGLLLFFPVMAWAASGGEELGPRNYPTTGDSIRYYYLAGDDDYATVTFMFLISSIGTGDTCKIIIEQGGWGSGFTEDDYWIGFDTLNSGAYLGSNTTFPYKEKVTITNKLSGLRIKVVWGLLGNASPWSMSWGYQYVFHNKY